MSSNNVIKATQHVIGAMVAVTMFASPALGQTSVSTLVGLVSDPQSHAIPRVIVTLENERTKFVYSGITDDSGNYSIPLIQPGSYTLKAEAASFALYQDHSIPIRSGEVRRYDLSLTLASVSSVINVEAAAPVINAETPTLTTTQEERLVSYKTGNDFLEDDVNTQAMYLPGASAGGYMTFYSGKFYETRSTGDGMIGTRERMSGPPDSYSEVKVMAVLAPAEYAEAHVVDAISKGGTSDFHGNFGYILNHPVLNARGPNNPAPRPPSKTSRYRILTVGGPVELPKVYDGRKKTFAFLSWVTTDQTTFGTAPQAVPPDVFRKGDFSRIAQLTNGAVTQIKNPFTGQAFLGNIIPASQIVPAANNVQATLPAAANQNSLVNNVTTLGKNYQNGLSQLEHFHH